MMNHEKCNSLFSGGDVSKNSSFEMEIVRHFILSENRQQRASKSLVDVS